MSQAPVTGRMTVLLMVVVAVSPFFLTAAQVGSGSGLGCGSTAAVSTAGSGSGSGSVEGGGTAGTGGVDECGGAASGVGSVSSASGNIASLTAGASKTTGSLSPNVTFVATDGGAIGVRVGGVNIGGTVVKPTITDVKIVSGSTLPALESAVTLNDCVATAELGCEKVVDLGSSSARQIDVGILLDTTGSMNVAVQTMSDEITKFVNALGTSGLDVSFGCSTFGDAFATLITTPQCDDGSACSGGGSCADTTTCTPIGSSCTDGSVCTGTCRDGSNCLNSIFASSPLVKGDLGEPPPPPDNSGNTFSFDPDERPDCGLTPLSAADAVTFWNAINTGYQGTGVGGNDAPENSLGVLDWFVKNFKWRAGSEREVVLITDACAHTPASIADPGADQITGPLDDWTPPDDAALKNTLTTGTPVTVNVIGGENGFCPDGSGCAKGSTCADGSACTSACDTTQDPLQLAADTGGQEKMFPVGGCGDASTCPIDLTKDIPLSGVLSSSQSTGCSYTSSASDTTFVIEVDISAVPPSGGDPVTGQFFEVLTATLR